MVNEKSETRFFRVIPRFRWLERLFLIDMRFACDGITWRRKIALAGLIANGFKRRTFNHGRRGTTRKRTGFCMPKSETCLALGHF